MLLAVDAMGIVVVDVCLPVHVQRQQALVGLRDLPELLLSNRILVLFGVWLVWVLVWMPFQRELVVGALDLLGSARRLQLQDIVETARHAGCFGLLAAAASALATPPPLALAPRAVACLPRPPIVVELVVFDLGLLLPLSLLFLLAHPLSTLPILAHLLDGFLCPREMVTRVREVRREPQRLFAGEYGRVCATSLRVCLAQHTPSVDGIRQRPGSVDA
mmetsp:Transcript_58351/g.137342  ORF Transcript_58351/g.137342 Transcript_58351/m.137342 type:complete len:218 (+) Transcript_58351:278-931(+)